MYEKDDKRICLWCGKHKKSTDVSVIYGNNDFFDLKNYYSCKGEHSKKLKKYLELIQKYYKHLFISIITAVVVYPIMMFVFPQYFQWITVLLCFDFGFFLLLFPFMTPDIVGKIGIQKSIVIVRIIAVIILSAGIALVIKLLE